MIHHSPSYALTIRLQSRTLLFPLKLLVAGKSRHFKLPNQTPPVRIQ
jgi:hypothetical protein